MVVSGNGLEDSSLTDGLGVTGSSDAVVIALSVSDPLSLLSVSTIDPQTEANINSFRDNTTWCDVNVTAAQNEITLHV